MNQRRPWWEGAEVEACNHDEHICSIGALPCCRACDHDGYLTGLKADAARLALVAAGDTDPQEDAP